MAYPKYPETTREEWWRFVDENWSSLQNIILSYYPNQSDFPKDGWPLPERELQNPQRACNVVIKQIRKEKPIWSNKGRSKKYIDTLKENQDPELATILNSTWFGMPESASSRRVDGFYIFCDLCSESYCLDER